MSTQPDVRTELEDFIALVYDTMDDLDSMHEHFRPKLQRLSDDTHEALGKLDMGEATASWAGTFLERARDRLDDIAAQIAAW